MTGRAISRLSSRFAFRNESRMYSGGSIAILGIVALATVCAEMLCTHSLSLSLSFALCTCTRNHYVGRAVRTVRTHTDASPRDAIRSLPPDCTYVICVRYASESASESCAKGGFQGCDIATPPRRIDIIFGFSDLFRPRMAEVNEVVRIKVDCLNDKNEMKNCIFSHLFSYDFPLFPSFPYLPSDYFIFV